MTSINLIHAALSILLLSSTAAWSHGKADSNNSDKAPRTVHETGFGTAGDPTRVTRTVRVAMSDNMRFTPADLSVKHGETIRFVVHNEGKVMHEMVLGTKEDLAKHAKIMRMSHEMTHDKAHMLHVAPGKTGEIIWEFSQAGTVHFGCLIPGHFEAGMIGKVDVKESAP